MRALVFFFLQTPPKKHVNLHGKKRNHTPKPCENWDEITYTDIHFLCAETASVACVAKRATGRQRRPQKRLGPINVAALAFGIVGRKPTPGTLWIILVLSLLDVSIPEYTTGTMGDWNSNTDRNQARQTCKFACLGLSMGGLRSQL